VQQELEKHPKASTRVLSALTGFDRSTVKDRLIYDLGMRKVATFYVPHDLTPSQKQLRVVGARALLDVLRKEKERGFASLITGDESYLHYDYPVKSQWLEVGSPPPVAVKDQIGARKKLLTVFFSGAHVWLTFYSDRGEMMGSTVFTEEVLVSLNEALVDSEEAVSDPVLLHIDNAPSHRSRMTTAKMKKLRFVVVPHPPYSPDLAPSDFWIFSYLKRKLQGLDISTDAKLEAEVDAILFSLTEETLFPVFLEWEKRCEWVMTHGGEYYPRRKADRET
jgi:histone-lysine N-methyltransferase SETMAR